jgi:prepilin-type N-terminal cleavage/methylation domain-containing protein
MRFHNRRNSTILGREQTRAGQKGFTLIELLVVIAIIGILASLVLVALASARTKAQDARIKSDVLQLRQLAEIHYDANNGSYEFFVECIGSFFLFGSPPGTGCRGGVEDSVETVVNDLLDILDPDRWDSGDIFDQGGWPTGGTNADNQRFCIAVVWEFFSPPWKYFCADTDGTAAGGIGLWPCGSSDPQCF